MRGERLVMGGLIWICAAGAFAQGALTPSGAPAPTMKTLDEIHGAVEAVNAGVNYNTSRNDLIQSEVSALNGDVSQLGVQVSGISAEIGGLDTRFDAVNAGLSFVTGHVARLNARIDLNALNGDADHEVAITAPGSYYLSGDLEVDKANGILVSANDVAIDLNGYRIVRGAGSGGFGVYVEAGADSFGARNGEISGFDYGVLIPVGYAHRASIQVVRMENCRLWALYLGEHSVVRDCEMSGNGSGAYVRAGSVVERCFFMRMMVRMEYMDRKT